MRWFWSAFQQIPSDLGIRPLSLLLPCIAASNKYDWSLSQKGEKNSPNSYIDILTALLPFKSYVPSIFCPIYPSSLPPLLSHGSVFLQAPLVLPASNLLMWAGVRTGVPHKCFVSASRCLALTRSASGSVSSLSLEYL